MSPEWNRQTGLNGEHCLILAIDDNADNLVSIQAIIGMVFPEAQVLTACDGPGGIALARSSDPDVILLDILMPGMDGFQVCTQLKSDPATELIPVVFLTALKADRKIRVAALEAGADAFLTKPVDEQELTAAIRAMFRIKEASRQKKAEKELLEDLVAERTFSLEKELAERRRIESELSASESRYRAIFGTMASGCCVDEIIYKDGVAVDYRILTVNPSWERILGISAARACGSLASDLYGISPPQDLAKYAHVAKTGGHTAFQTYFAPVGKHLDITVSCPAPGMFSNVFTDATERKRAEAQIMQLNADLEKRVLDRTAQLQELNQELDSFSRSVSHDLRAPLRAIDGFTRMLEEANTEKLDQESQRYISVIRKNTRKMDDLITALLHFSRTGKVAIAHSRIDMGAMVSSILADDFPQETRDGFALDIAPLPDAWGDPILIRQVWSNLLANAFKYSKKSVVRKIEIRAQTLPEETVYSIQDWGAGFNPAYTDRIFDLFKRLHKADDFEGMGVGLAIVQRIILRHGGRVSAEGQEGRGATFRFSLPVLDSLRDQIPGEELVANGGSLDPDT